MQFQLFQTPIDLAHAYWQQLLKPGDRVIDATCGNGHDTLFLAKLILDKENIGGIIVLDKQECAIANTKKLLGENLPEEFLKQVSFHTQCHSSFPAHLHQGSIALLVYNLGYLPGGDRTLTTERPTTIESVSAGLPLIAPGGAISITCYPGHEEGKSEEEALLNFVVALDPKQWSCCFHRWVNRRNSPSLIFIQRSQQ
jgi:Putative rRNA methylase